MLVKVWNDNVHDYKEKFKGEMIHIKPGNFVEMDLNEAHQFLGTMPPNIEVDGNGIQKPECYKKLRIDESKDVQAKGVKHDTVNDRNGGTKKV